MNNDTEDYLRIAISSLFNGAKQIIVKKDSTMLELMTKVCHEFSYELDEIKIVYKGKHCYQTHKDVKLSDLGVANGDVMRVVLRLGRDNL